MALIRAFALVVALLATRTHASLCVWPTNWKDWVNVGSCDTSCGTGLQRMMRDCSVCSGACDFGKEEKFVTCNVGVQKAWSDWANVDKCSTTCGTGTQYQTRTCSGCWGTCSGVADQYISCTAGPLFSWTVWVDAGNCSTSCGVGVRSQTRNCAGCLGACAGNSTQLVICASGPLKSWTPWVNTTFCSTSCGVGSQSQSRTCSGCVGSCTGISVQTAGCSSGGQYTWTNWQDAGELGCTSNCMKSVARSCLGCTGTLCNGPSTTAEFCAEGSWTAWSAASSCNATCGAGSQLMNRTCIGCPIACTGAPTELVACSAGAMREWTAWHVAGPCSSVCGYGTQLLTRSCIGCQGDCLGNSTQQAVCEAGPPMTWTPWVNIGVCDAVCGDGQQQQTRNCTGCLGSCLGLDTQFEMCSAGAVRVWSAWEDSTTCTVPCGNGTKNQSRACIGCTGVCPATDLSQRSLSCFSAMPRIWTAWLYPANSACLLNCSRPRVRSCEGCQGPVCGGPALEFEACNEGAWSAWVSPAGGCEDSCGSISFVRECSGCRTSCNGSQIAKVEICGTVPPPIWGVWAAWGCCTVSGIRERSQLCTNGTCPLSLCVAGQVSPEVQESECVYRPECTASSTKASGSGGSSTVAIAAPVAVVLIVILIAVVVLFVVVRRRQHGSNISNTASRVTPFKDNECEMTPNPMYETQTSDANQYAVLSTNHSGFQSADLGGSQLAVNKYDVLQRTNNSVPTYESPDGGDQPFVPVFYSSIAGATSQGVVSYEMVREDPSEMVPGQLVDVQYATIDKRAGSMQTNEGDTAETGFGSTDFMIHNSMYEPSEVVEDDFFI